MKKLILILITFIILAATFFFLKSVLDPKINQNFLNTLPGRIVFLNRDGQDLNLYTIFANGKDKKSIYHNSDSVNSNIIWTSWSKDGSRIYFGAMKDGKWGTFSINSNGEDLRFIGYDDEKGTMPCVDCKTLDRQGIFVDQGSLYYRDADDKVVQVFHWKYYDSKFNRGAGDGYNFKAALSPDRRYIVFSVSGWLGESIYIANKEGTKISKVTSGRDPDWIN